MTKSRLKVALLFGGRSAEHEVSLRSAGSIFAAMDKTRYEIIPILLTQSGAWFKCPSDSTSFESGRELSSAERLVFSPDPEHGGFLKLYGDRIEPMQVDVVFPVLHGTFGEDGTVQGLLELANIPYVGCGVLASSVGMDKVLMKAAFRDAGLLVGPFFWFLRTEWNSNRSAILERLKESRFPVFVKPANLGSSVGITKVKDIAGFESAVEKAATFDRKILVEDGILGRELEVSVLGNDVATASLPGEVISHSDFYDYEEKYLKDTAELQIPADLPEESRSKARQAALLAFRAVDGSGLARVDMFLTPADTVIVNEINTLPGFTSISMYPKLWEATGLPYDKLIDRLIDSALERHVDKQAIRTDRSA